MTGDAGESLSRRQIRRQREFNVDTIGGQELRGAVGPFHQPDGVRREVGKAHLDELLGPVHAIKIGMDHRAARQVISLHQRKGGARHVERAVADEVPDQGAREGGLSATEIACEGHHVAGRAHGGDIAGQPMRRAFVQQHQIQAFAAGSGGRHRGRMLHHHAARSSGNAQATAVPRPLAESILTLPPCSSTSDRTIDRPSPTPRWREPPAWVSNRSNTRSCSSTGMPGPLSVTENTTDPFARSAASVTVPPGGEKPMALDKRLYKTCRTRRSSAVRIPISGSVRMSRVISFSLRRSLIPSAAASMVLRMSTEPRLSVIAPASMVARSRISLMIASRAALEPVI